MIKEQGYRPAIQQICIARLMIYDLRIVLKRKRSEMTSCPVLYTPDSGKVATCGKEPIFLMD
jgi:hypothetical protein